MSGLQWIFSEQNIFHLLTRLDEKWCLCWSFVKQKINRQFFCEKESGKCTEEMEAESYEMHFGGFDGGRNSSMYSINSKVLTQW